MLPLIQIKNLTVRFPGTKSSEAALQQFSLELFRGEMLAVVGESGSGKTVMSLALMNVLSPAARIESGSILFSPDGKTAVELLGMSEKQSRRYRGNQLAMIFQEPMTSLNPLMTCGTQLMEPLMLHRKMMRRAAREEALLLFEKVQLPDPEIIFSKYPHQLSGGQKQRVMIAMAMSCQPSVLICDEPTTALDVRVQKTILDLLKELRRSENIGMIFITHDLGLVADMADRAIVMLRGRLVEEGPVARLFNHPGHPYTKGLLMCRPALHRKGQRLPLVSDYLNGTDPESLTLPDSKSYQHIKETDIAEDKFFVSNSNPELVHNENGTRKEILVRVRNLQLRYSSGKTWLGKEKLWTDAIKDIEFDVYKGETLGIVGESGSGKTSIGRALLGLNIPYSGTVTYGNQDLLTMRRSHLLAFRRNIQMVFQDPYSSLNPRLTIGRAIEEPVRVHQQMDGLERKELVLDLLSKVDLRPEQFNRYPHAFSGGQRQRIVIARALALHPGFVVFDESVSALDLSVQAQVLNLINDLKKKLGFTAVFISHDLSVIRYLCDRVLVMEKGRIVESGSAEDIYLHPETEYTRSLIEAIPGKSLKLKA